MLKSSPPIVAIPACAKLVDGYPQHATPARYGEALMRASGAVPLLIPPEGEAMLALLDRIDGILFSGSPSNVAPAAYGVPVDQTPGQHDPARDATTLPLIRAALRRGMPILCICRGMQELNVALGGTLFQEVHKEPGRLDHRAGEGTRTERFALKHTVRLSGAMARIAGAEQIEVNSLHGQALDRVAAGLVVEAVAPDGIVEAVRVDGQDFAMAVQWHPEWDVLTHPDRRLLFEAFGAACNTYAQGLKRAA